MGAHYKVGSKNHNAKVDEERVKWIRENFIPGDPKLGRSALMTCFGLGRTSFEQIIQGITWKHVVPTKAVYFLNKEQD